MAQRRSELNYDGTILTVARESGVTDESSLSDEMLVLKLRAGRMDALGELYARYSTMVQKAVLRTAPFISDADKEELVHEVFLSLLTLASKFDAQRLFRPWLYGVSMKMTQNFVKKSGARQRLLARQTAWMESLPENPVDEQMERHQMVERALSRIPGPQAEVLVLHTVEGFKGEEIALMLDVEINTVWTRLHRGRANLLQALDEERHSAQRGSHGGL